MTAAANDVKRTVSSARSPAIRLAIRQRIRRRPDLVLSTAQVPVHRVAIRTRLPEEHHHWFALRKACDWSGGGSEVFHFSVHGSTEGTGATRATLFFSPGKQGLAIRRAGFVGRCGELLTTSGPATLGTVSRGCFPRVVVAKVEPYHFPRLSWPPPPPPPPTLRPGPLPRTHHQTNCQNGLDPRAARELGAMRMHSRMGRGGVDAIFSYPRGQRGKGSQVARSRASWSPDGY